MDDVKKRFLTLQAAIAGRAQLIAVSKTVSTPLIEQVITLNQSHFGENYVQETQGKWPNLREKYAVTLHMIGPLQSNKAKEAVQLYDVIQTLDRVSLAAALAKETQKQGRSPRLLVQVNTGSEPQKGGILPEKADDFIKQCRRDYGLNIEGLMCIPPADQPPRPHFKLLKATAERNGLKELSMGMSADYQEAIEEGATFIRVGSALFGSRG